MSRPGNAANVSSPSACEECGNVTAEGRNGDGDFEGHYFCNSCWSKWDQSFAAPPDFGDRFPPGQEVWVVDLPRRPDLKRCRGVVLWSAWDRDPGSVHVSLHGRNEEIATKPECLKLFEWRAEHLPTVVKAHTSAAAQLAIAAATSRRSALQQKLVSELRGQHSLSILDLGSGFGCDAMHFATELGASVTMLEACESFAEAIEEPTRGQLVLHCPFDFYELCHIAKIELLGWRHRFRLLWANASLSHLTKQELRDLLPALHFLVPPGGLLAAIIHSSDESCASNCVFGCPLATFDRQEFAHLLEQAGWHVRDLHVERQCVHAGAWLHVVAVSSGSSPMMGPLVRRTLEYHEKSSLGPGGRAKGGSMDWGKQPDKFLRFRGTKMIDLDLNDGSWVARVLRYAFGITAWKGIAAHGARWSLRANASSGALQPLEFYIMGDKIGIGEYDGPPALFHYHSFWHALEILHDLPEELWTQCKKQLPIGSVLIAISAFYWRNAWKYGDPGFRYVQQDVGHALGALGYSALTEGARCVLLEGLSDATLSSLLGLAEERPAAQQPQALIALVPANSATVSNFILPARLCASFAWQNQAVNEGPLPPVCCDGHRATWKGAAPVQGGNFWRRGAPAGQPLSWNADELRRFILQRRSCHGLRESAWVSQEVFLQTLRVAMPSMAPFDMLPYCRPLVPVVLFFVHRVRGLTPGLYAFVRDEARLEWLRGSCFTRRYAWQRVADIPDLPLFLLSAEDVSQVAQQSSAQQEIARTGVASCAVFAEHEPLLCEFGAWMYRRAHWEAGMVVQAMYIASEAAGCRGTAMGAFLGPWAEDVLGVNGKNLAILEHWTFGEAIEDERLETSEAYEHLAALRARGNHPSSRDAVSTAGF